MTSLRRPLGLLVLLAVFGAVASGCSDSYVGEVEAATVVVHGSPPCNVELTDDGYERHGLDCAPGSTGGPRIVRPRDSDSPREP